MSNEVAEDLYQRKVRKLVTRRWQAIEVSWLHFPEASSTPGERPTDDLFSLADLQAEIRMTSGKQPREVEQPPKSVYSSILKESFFQLQKACNLLDAALSADVSDKRNCAISLSYHASLVASRSLLGFLGISFGRLKRGDHDVLVDCFGRRATKTSDVKGAEQVLWLLQLETQVRHGELWKLFQKAIDRTVFPGDILSAELRGSLLGFDPTRCAHARNRLQYNAAYWPYDDPVLPLYNRHIPYRPKSLEWICSSLVDPESQSFSLCLGLALIYTGAKMLSSLSINSNAFAAELQVIRPATHRFYDAKNI